MDRRTWTDGPLEPDRLVRGWAPAGAQPPHIAAVPPRPVVAFLDRDGTINVKAVDGAYVTDPADLVLLPDAAGAIRALNDRDVLVVVVTNQRGIALGVMTEADLDAVHQRLRDLLQEESGATIDLIIHCPHDYDQCECRKPLPGMLVEAALRIGELDLGNCVMIGDSHTDVEAGRAFGIATDQLGVESGSLAEAVERFLSRQSPGARCDHDRS